jgi:hypothetical protein
MNNNISHNLKLVSKPSEVFTSFKGPLISFPVTRYVDRENGILRRWTVFSQGKRSTLVKYLYGKWLWDELNSYEREFFWYLEEVTRDLTIYLSLKAYANGVSKRVLRQRLEKSPFPELQFLPRQQYLTIKGRVTFFLLEESVNLRRVPKFSGYTRHHKDHGSLRPQRERISEIFEPSFDVCEDVLFHYLTVGEFTLFGRVVTHPDEIK